MKKQKWLKCKKNYSIGLRRKMVIVEKRRDSFDVTKL